MTSIPRMAATLAAAVLPVAAAAQEACKPVTLKEPAVKLAEIYRIAEGHAKAWKPVEATPRGKIPAAIAPIAAHRDSIRPLLLNSTANLVLINRLMCALG